MSPTGPWRPLLGLSLAAWLAACTTPSLSNLDALNRATVLIEHAKGHGTGTIVGPNQVLTAYHVVADAPVEVNYAMLHNQTPLLPRFAVRKFAHENDRIHAEVALQVGTNRFVWESNHDLTARVTDLAPLIQVPLTWSLESLPSERVRSIMSIVVPPALVTAST